jgi:hypothetical protein
MKSWSNYRLIIAPTSPPLLQVRGNSRKRSNQPRARPRWGSETTRCVNYSLSLYTGLDVAGVRIGRFSRVAHLAHILWKVSFDCTRAKPARHYHHRSLEITPTQHPGLFLLLSPHPARTDLPPTRLHSLTRYTPFKTHLHAFHSHNSCGSANRA